MNHLYLPDTSNIQNGSKSLIIIFLGWGFPTEMFSSLKKNGFDLLLLSNYTDLNSDNIEKDVSNCLPLNLSEYNEVVVIAWSFGVKVASYFLSQTNIPVTLRLAVNGTEFHIDDSRGIPVEIFKGTLAGLNERNLMKFRIRCMGSRELFSTFFEKAECQHPVIDYLRAELDRFGHLSSLPIAHHTLWDKVIIGEEDHIFHAENQKRAWEGYDIFLIKDMPHFPNMQWILDNFVVDKRKVSDKFGNAADSYTDNAVIQRSSATKLFRKFLNILDGSSLKMSDKFVNNQLSLLELGYGDGTFTRLYLSLMNDRCKKIILSDLKSAEIHSVYENNKSCFGSADDKIKYVKADAESADFIQEYLKEKSFDIIFSSSMFQWLNSPGMMLKRCCNALCDNGMMVLSFYGPDTFKEIRHTIGTGLKYPSPQWMERIARECDVNINLVETEEDTIFFDSPSDALRHLKLTGVNGLPGKSSPSRTRYLLNNWPSNTDGKTPLTFQPVYMILTKK